MNKITLHVDYRTAFLGQVLMVTDNASGKPISYGIARAKPDDVATYSAARCIKYHRLGENDRDARALSRYFTDMKGSAKKVDVYGEQSSRRYPSACAYAFDTVAAPGAGADPPCNFDYGLCRAVTPLVIPPRASLSEALKEIKRDAFDEEMAHGFPGITSRASFLRALKTLECEGVEEDIISEPWYPEYLQEWWPAVRKDGRVGVYESTNEAGRGYLVLESALPYFVSDQILALMRKNPDAWTWGQWESSDELRAALALAAQSAEAVQRRAVEILLARPNGARLANERFGAEKVLTVTNVLRLIPGGDVVYDAEVLRAADWHLKRVLFVRFLTRDDGATGYALLRNMDCGGAVFTSVIPSTFSVASARDAEHTIKMAFDSDLRGVITIDILKELY
jgi:hypothetical protein